MSQSCGRHTAAVAAACSGSWSASQRSLLAVIAATGTTPMRFAHSAAPPSSTTSSAAALSERVSFHSNASRTTSPDSFRHTMPCCWAPTDTAATSSKPPALSMAVCRAAHHSCGSTSVPSGCGAVPDRAISPLSASHTSTLQDCVEESTPATRVTSAKLPRYRAMSSDVPGSRYWYAKTRDHPEHHARRIDRDARRLVRPAAPR